MGWVKMGFALVFLVALGLWVGASELFAAADHVGQAFDWANLFLVLLGLVSGGSAAAPVILGLQKAIKQAMVVYDQQPQANRELINDALENGAKELATKMARHLPLSDKDRAEVAQAIGQINRRQS